jgi:exonuclease III
MALSLISWNINGSNFSEIEDYVNEILALTNVDIFIFFEGANIVDNSLSLLKYEAVTLHNVDSSKKAIKIFIKSGINYEISNLNNFSEIVSKDINIKSINSLTQAFVVEEVNVIRRIERISTLETFQVKNITNSKSFLLAAIHMPSKLYQDDFDQLQSAINYKKSIIGKAAEFKNKIIITGDFNMAPYEKGMTEPMGFFTFQNENQVRDKHEYIFGRQLSFYNPCWRLMGDYNIKKRTNRTGGSFFYSTTKKRKLMTWHLIDQVIMTKNMVTDFDQDSLEIVETDLLLKDLIDSSKKIDHLPLHFTLKF